MGRMKDEFIRMQEAGEIPQGASVEDMIPVRCNHCHWGGYTPMLKVVYKPNLQQLGDVIPTPGCPSCLSDQYLEYIDIDNVANLQFLAILRNIRQYELERMIGYRRDIPF